MLSLVDFHQRTSKKDACFLRTPLLSSYVYQFQFGVNRLSASELEKRFIKVSKEMSEDCGARNQRFSSTRIDRLLMIISRTWKCQEAFCPKKDEGRGGEKSTSKSEASPEVRGKVGLQGTTNVVSIMTARHLAPMTSVRRRTLFVFPALRRDKRKGWSPMWWIQLSEKRERWDLVVKLDIASGNSQGEINI